jgi:putative MFS transporter
MKETRILNSAVLVGALGYFVDIYDLLLFSIVRVPSLKSLGVPPEQLMEVGLRLINLQMIGLLLGGLLWGILGDKKGRVSVLFGSIFLYSAANLANAFVQDVHTYGALRFLAGVGLAGELGAAITLVSEVMSKETRGYGTAVVASVGILGAVVAALVGDLFDWRIAYAVGGVLGLGLLALRMKTLESGLFEQTKKHSNAKHGDFFMLFKSGERFRRYLGCILVGVPIWYVIGLLITFSPELSRHIGVQGEVSGGRAIMWAYMGLSLGDLTTGLLSQALKSRKKVIASFCLLTLALVSFYCFSQGLSVSAFYGLCACLGFSTGYWAVFVTNASEQFGTNLRATVATTAPNFVRGSLAWVTAAYEGLKPGLGIIPATYVVGVGCIAIALFALVLLREPYGRDLDFLET